MTTPPFQTDHPASFPLFDWLRFTLASAVALGHEGVISWGPAGNFAVQIFFALSGWLIGGILLRTGPDQLPKFFFKRGVRIWLPYLVAVGAIYLLGALRDGVDPAFFRFLFYDLTFTHNWFIDKVAEVTSAMPLEGTGTHFWSISVEEQFYLASPLLIVLLPWGRSIGLWVLIAATAYLLQSWYASISFGVLAAVAQYRLGNWHQTAAVRALLAAIVAVLIVPLIVASPSYGWVAPPLAVGVVLLAAFEGVRGPLGSFLGGMAYPLYLHHWVGIFAANFMTKRLGIALPSVGWTAYLITFAVGAVAYLLIDCNIHRHRDHWYTRERGIAFACAAYALMAVGVLGGVSLQLVS